MITAWRIVKARGADSAFDGEGARLFGGRWNSPGIPMVYTASSRALAALEMAVHLDRSTLLQSFNLIACRFEERLVTAVDRQRLPREWRSNPAPTELAAIGDAWVRAGRSAVLAVPSAVIEEELNYLLNPRHPQFKKVKLAAPRVFEFDRRLIE